MLEFEIAMAADEYESGEPLTATLTLTNTGHKSAVVNVRMAPNLPLAPDEQREVVFTLKSPSGAELPVRVFVNVRPPLDKDFAELAPGESVSRSMDLATFYSFSAPGKYTLQAVYKNVSDPSTGVAWKGQLGSDVVTFSVSE